MQGVQLAASKLTLHSGQIKVITITGGVMFQELSNEQAYRSQLAIKKGTETSPLPGLYLSNCKADKKKKKKGHCYIEQNNLHSNWKTKGLDTDPLQRMSNTGHH